MIPAVAAGEPSETSSTTAKALRAGAAAAAVPALPLVDGPGAASPSCWSKSMPWASCPGDADGGGAMVVAEGEADVSGPRGADAWAGAGAREGRASEAPFAGGLK